MAGFVLVMIPFLNFGLSTGFISSLSVPEFISDYITDNSRLSLLAGGVVAILCVFLVRWIYSLHYVVLEGKNFKEARKGSANLIRRSYIKDIFTFIAAYIVTTVLYLAFLFAGIFLIYLISSVFRNALLIESLATTAVWIFLAISVVVFTALSVPVSYAILSAVFYAHKMDTGEEIVEVTYSKRKENKISNQYIRCLAPFLCIIAFICGTVFTYGVYKGDYNLNIEYVRTMEITAHRGASVDYPENTMKAFIGAKELGADWIELDVQQTEDGKIIVIHDTNLSRTTGVDKNTWEVTYDEIKDLDAGSFLDKKFSDSRIPLLEDV